MIIIAMISCPWKFQWCLRINFPKFTFEDYWEQYGQLLSGLKQLEVPPRCLPRISSSKFLKNNHFIASHHLSNAVGSHELFKHSQMIFHFLCNLFMARGFHLVFQGEHFQQTSKHSWNVIEIFPSWNAENNYQPSTSVSFRLLATHFKLLGLWRSSH